MSQLIDFMTDDGLAIGFELSETAHRSVVKESAAIGPRDISAIVEPVPPSNHVTRKLEAALESLKPLAGTIISTLSKLAVPPDQAEVEFAFGMKAEGGIFVAKGTTEGNFKVKLTWKRETGK
ncbi:MAG: CU044_2847 family protein [Pseudomonadota bacterium]